MVRAASASLALAFLGTPALAGASPTITATKSDQLVVDENGDGQVNAGDTLEYTIVITNTGDMDALDVEFSDIIDPDTTLVPGSVNVLPIAVDDMYMGLGNTARIVMAAADGVLANDFDPDDPLTVSAFQNPSTAGGTVNVNPDGSFEYFPPVGFTGPDTFAYTADDGRGGTDTATVTLTFNDLVWYVDNTATPGGDGTLAAPFDELADAEAASGPADLIYVFEGTGPYVGPSTGIVLKSDQTLLGQGVPLEVVLDGSPVTIVPAAGRPLILSSSGAAIDLAADNTIRGLDVAAQGGPGIFGASAGALVVSEANVAANGGPSLDLDDTALAVEVDSLDSQNSLGPGLVVTSSTGSLASASTSVSNPGTDAIFLQSNPTATIDLGSLGNLRTTNGRGLFALDVGTVDLSGSPAISAIGGAALDVRNTGTGSGWTFDSLVSSGSPSEGVSLEFVTGGAVTVNRATLVFGPGGTGVFLFANDVEVSFDAVEITGARPKGIEIANQQGNVGFADVDVDGATIGLSVEGSNANVSFSSIDVRNAGGDGIRLAGNGGSFAVTGLGFQGTGGTIESPGDDGIDAVNVSAMTLSGITIRGISSGAAGIRIVNAGGPTPATFVIDGGRFEDSTTGDSFVQLSGRLATDSTLEITNSTFTNLVGQAVQASAGDSPGSTAKINTTIRRNTFFEAATAGGLNGIFLSTAENGEHDYTIEDNVLRDVARPNANAGVISTNTTGGDLAGVISGNTIENSTGRRGISIVSEPLSGTASVDVTIDDNDIDELPNREAILVDLRSSTTTGDVRVTNNRIGDKAGSEGQIGGSRDGLSFRARGLNPTLDLLVENNTIRVGNDVPDAAVDIDSEDSATVNATVRNNTIVNIGKPGGIGPVGNGVEVAAEDSGSSACADISGNAVGTIELDNAAGATLAIEDASTAALSANNSGATVIVPGAPITFNAVCPEPAP